MVHHSCNSSYYIKDRKCLENTVMRPQPRKWTNCTNETVSHQYQSKDMMPTERRKVMGALMLLTEKRDKSVKG